MAWSLLSMFAICLLGLGPSNQTRLNDWWTDFTEQSLPQRALTGARVELTVTEAVLLTESELAQLRTEVRSKPEHPRRALLESIESQIKNGPASRPQLLWVGADGQTARISENADMRGGDPYDAAVRGDATWLVHGQTLSLTAGTPGARVDAAPALVSASLKRARGIVTAGISGLRERGFVLTPPPTLIDGSRWTGTWSKGNDPRETVTAMGSMDQASGRVRLDRLNFNRQESSGKTISGSVEFDDWRVSATGRYMPHHQRYPTAEGDMQIDIRLVSITPIDEALVATVTADPDPSIPDPYRGVWAFTTVRDRRGSTTDPPRRPDGSVISIEDADPDARRGQSVIIAGWSLAAVITLFLTGIWIRKHKGA